LIAAGDSGSARVGTDPGVPGLVAERARHANRIQKVLEDANIKLGSVAADVLGVSGRAMLQRLMAGQDDPASAAGSS